MGWTLTEQLSVALSGVREEHVSMRDGSVWNKHSLSLHGVSSTEPPNSNGLRVSTLIKLSTYTYDIS